MNYIWFEKRLSMNNDAIYSSRIRIADIIVNPEMLSVVERLGIKLGFGDATIDEICTKYGLSSNLFLIICDFYLYENYTPNLDHLTANDIPKLIGYLQKTHTYWLNTCFPRLHTNIHTMLDSCDEINKKVLNKFYDDYDIEVKKHLDFEENIVFPYILSEKKDVNDFRIKDFEKNHGNIDEKLNDLKNILIKYLSEDYQSTARTEVLNDIFIIEQDLNKHSLIENKLLIPLVAKFESK